jgi:hypothetical protein
MGGTDMSPPTAGRLGREGTHWGMGGARTEICRDRTHLLFHVNQSESKSTHYCDEPYAYAWLGIFTRLMD